MGGCTTPVGERSRSVAYPGQPNECLVRPGANALTRRGAAYNRGARSITRFGRRKAPLMSIPYAALRAFKSKHVFNPWADVDPLDLAGRRAMAPAGANGRLARLTAHLNASPRLVLLGEASGYQGCHFSGIPFTNEKLLLAGRIPRVPVAARITSRPRPWCEPSATVVWGALHALGLADDTVLWNAFAWHPHRPGSPYSNRAPTRDELEAGRSVLDGVLDAFPQANVVAVGKVAERALRALGREPAATLRHPSMGGATEFRAGLAALARGFRCDRALRRRRR